ncbi:DUF4190 domain-containing protein [Metamycoplasma hominis]|uniref:DUF4190 domain-containing protein n=1 Tax=Metamycoplasma hominis TaxID=2098 RepID=UPI001F51A3F5|nr:DUF4190 domain-containing protein [Metamycoplasma hominis]
MEKDAYVTTQMNTMQPSQPYLQPQQQIQNSATNEFAIVGFILSFFFSILGLIFSCIGLSKSKSMNDSGRTLSIAEIIISCLTMFFAFVIFVTVMSVSL